jgi:hypothetical protein
MSYKNIFFLKKNVNTDGVYSLNNFDPKINIEKINNIYLPNELDDYQAYAFDEFHANGGISQMGFSSDNFKEIFDLYGDDQSITYGALAKSYHNEQEALKIEFIIFYIFLFLKIEHIGITSIDDSDDINEFNCNNFNVKYAGIWSINTNSLLELPANTILLIQ